MKRLLLIAICLWGITFCQAQSLPTEANHFINTFFPDATETGISFYDHSEMAYRVELSSDITVGFNSDGQWIEVESFSSDITQVLSQQLRQAIVAHGENPRNAVRINRNPSTGITKVTYNDGLRCEFDANGTFLRKVVE